MTPRTPAPAREYHDIAVELRDLDGQDRFWARLSGPSVGEIAPQIVDLAATEIDEPLHDLECDAVDDESELIGLGRALSDRLFPSGAIRAAIVRVLQSISADDGVRIRVLTREPRLAQLPWELCYMSRLDRHHPADFLALDPRVSIVRHEPLPLPHPAPGHDRTRVRLVLVVANASGYPQLDLRRERRVVERALESVRPEVDLEVLEDPDLSELQTALARGADIFHFAGHGTLSDDTGALALPTDEVPAALIAALLRHSGVRLAVLGACETGRRDGVSPWPGVAMALVAAQVPTVVAMQYRIRDSYAVKIARGLYTCLASGLTVDEAVSFARILAHDPDDVTPAWATPVLYSRSPAQTVLRKVDSRASVPTRHLIQQVVRTIEETGSVRGLRLAFGADGLFHVRQRADSVRGQLIGMEVDGPATAGGQPPAEGRRDRRELPDG